MGGGGVGGRRLCLGAATFAINAPLYFVYIAHGEGTDESARVDTDCELPKMLATRRSSNDKSPPTHPHIYLLPHPTHTSRTINDA